MVGRTWRELERAEYGPVIAAKHVACTAVLFELELVVAQLRKGAIQHTVRPGGGLRLLVGENVLVALPSVRGAEGHLAFLEAVEDSILGALI